MGKTKRLTIIFYIIIFLFNNFLLYANNNDQLTSSYIENKIIKVACVDKSGYIKKNSPSTYNGYLVDYLNKLGEIHNLNFKYILFSSNEECLNAIRNNDVDISCLQYKKSNIINEFSFSDTAIISLNTNLYTLANNNKYYYGDLENFNNMKIGIRNDLPTLDLFYQYTIENNISFTLKNYNTEEDLQKALLNNEVDSIVTNYSLFSDIELKKIDQISTNKTYIISKKENPVMNEINKSLNWIYNSNPNMFRHLSNKHSNSLKSYTEFTKEEAQYIKESKTLKVGLLPDTYIQSRYNNKTNQFEGVIVEYMKELSKISNLKFKYIQIPFGLKIQDAIDQGICDISPYLNRNEETLNDNNITSSITYINMRQLIAINKDNPKSIDDIKTISAPANYQGLLNHIYNEYNSWEIIKTNANKILDPLLAQVVDVAIGNEYELKYLMQKPKYSNLLLTETFLTDIELSIGISSKNDSRLLSIINKSISNINYNTIESIKLKGLLTNYQYTFFDSYFANSNFFNLIILLLFTIIICLILFVKYQRNINFKNKQKEIELNISNKKYEKADKAKTEFLASMSHDLRTPMNAIIGLTELSKNNINNKEQLKQYINKIDISSKYLLGLINDILDISAIEDGKLSIAQAPLDLKSLIQELTAMYCVNAQQKDIKFYVHLDKIYNENLIGDYLRIKQIITNLLSNAFKFTPEKGTIELKISEISNAKDVTILNISVKDTGIGIPKNLQNKIFKKFIQVDTKAINETKGSGLGLSIVSNLVNLMNGNISLESYENEGSTFSIKLPLKIDSSIKRPKLDDINNIENKILILDEDIKSNLYIKALLRSINVINDYSINLSQAIKLTKKAEENNNPYNIIFIDKDKFDINDSFLNSELYKYYTQKHKHIIIEGYDISYLKNSIQKYNIDFYLEKPIFLSSLTYLINNLTNLKLQQPKEEDISNTLKGLNVLLIEDNKINQLVGRKIIENFGCTVTIAENGLNGFETFIINDGNNFDIILMDIRMPIMDGFESAKKIRNSLTKNGKTIKIYAMTANVTKEDIEKCLDFGMNGHIPKPIENKKLYTLLKQEWLIKYNKK